MSRLIWTPETRPNDECGYDHTIAETPFGRFLLTWKGWKESWNMGMGFDETPWGEPVYDGWDSVEEAQAWAEAEFVRRCEEFLKGVVCEGKDGESEKTGVPPVDIR
jgi:hypothetical protein